MTRRANQRRPRGPSDGAGGRRRALAVAVGLLPAAAAFAPPPPRRARAAGRALAADDAAFDPFAQSPLSFGAPEPPGAVAAVDPDAPEPSGAAADARAADGAAASDPPARAAAAVEFDPLLSPHAYARGADAGPTPAGPPAAIAGVLLIDHGSKRPASNAHIHNVAQMYEERLRQQGGATFVRAAHMEIAAPSIVESLRALVADDGVTKVVCVPYFLSPGRHATEDIPALIAEARAELAGEGCAAEIVTSAALGTQLDGMLGAVDALVERSLN